MNAGALRFGVEVQAPTQTADADGGFAVTWTTLPEGEVWANIQPFSGGFIDRRFGEKIAGITSHLVTIRYLSGVTTACRVKFGSRVFNVRGVGNVDERNRTLLLACEEANV